MTGPASNLTRGIFVSHSHEDDKYCHDFVAALRELLGTANTVWYDEHNLGSGELLAEIQRNLHARPIFIVVLSKAALHRSQWVADECKWAYQLRQREPARVILPVTGAPIDTADFYPDWIYLEGFRRIEAPGTRPYPAREAARRAYATLTGGNTSARTHEQVPQQTEQHKPFETTPSLPARPNFFVLLELDPDVPWNPTGFEIRLKEKQNQWAREANSPKADVKNAANRNLRLSGEIQKVLREETSRRQEAENARSVLAATKAARLIELQFAIELYQSGTSVTRNEFERLAKEYADVISEGDLHARLGVSIVEAAEQAAGPLPPQGLDPSTARRIRDNLKFLGEASLYSFLSKESTNSSASPLSSESPSADLLAAAQELYKCMMSSLDTGPENTARKRLAGDAMDVFGDEVKRRRYDTSLRREPLERLLEEVERLCQVAGRITPARAELFLRKAREAGVPIAEAGEALNQLIIAKKWPQLSLSDSMAKIQRLRSCANCHFLNEPTAKYCGGCGGSLG